MNWRCATIFGASGGIGGALCERLAATGVPRIHAGSRSGAVPRHEAVHPFRFDLADEATIAAAAEGRAGEPLDLMIVATGVLTLPDGSGPERSYKMLDAHAMEQAMRLNVIGPALIAKHFLPLFARDRRSVFAVLSAKVGSIADNRIGGWHSYRAGKAALNMLVRNFGIELGRTHERVVVAALHPGTVDTRLSQPFQKNLPSGQVTVPDRAARNLLEVIDGLRPQDSGGLFARDGERLFW